MSRMQKALRVLLALPAFILLAAAIVYAFDIGGLRQVMIDAYVSIVDRLILPVVDELFGTEPPQVPSTPGPP